MCLWADTKDPFKSRCKPLKFDEKGYVICWKIYRSYLPEDYHKKRRILYPLYQFSGLVGQGWVRSGRKVKAGFGSDINKSSHIIIYKGIHVYTSIISARRELNNLSYLTSDLVLVPVRCHKSDLVAMDKEYAQAVFKKVFIEKEDYKKAIK